MVSHGARPISIPSFVWELPEMMSALRTRDLGAVFFLVWKHAEISQTQIGAVCDLAQGKVSELISGSAAPVEKFEKIERIAVGLGMPDHARMMLGLAPRDFRHSIPARDEERASALPAQAGSRSVDLVHQSEGDDDSVRRRRFIGLTGAALFHAAMAEGHVEGGWLEEIAAALTEEQPCVDHRPLGLPSLTTAVGDAKRGFQGCGYTEVARALPTTLRKLRLASRTYEGDDRLRTQALMAEAYHVAASLLLKREDSGLAWLAADRSMHAAHASQNQRMIASSSRILTHVLMSEHYNQTATDVATRTAHRMSVDLDKSNADDLSVYGSLLLRGAIAAAQLGNRHTVAELLDEAEDAGNRLGRDDNRMWTAFGPTNVLVHRVTVNLTQGDAGAALDAARKIDLNKVLINERKAVLLTHTAKAFLQWEKHDRAFDVLRATNRIAPEEITFWPSTRRLVGDLLATAPPSLRRDVREFATEIGVNA